MICRFYKPHPLLQSFVTSIMIYEHQYDRAAPLPVNLFPAIPEHSLYFYLRDPLIVHHFEKGTTQTAPPSIIVGPQVKRVNLSLGHDHLVIRVGFQAGGLYRLLRMPLHTIVDYTVSSDDVMGSAINETTARLRDSKNFDEIKSIVETFLLRRLVKVAPEQHIDRALQLLLKEGGSLSMDYLASVSCLSYKQFNRKCKERIGLSPKLFARIIRFSKAYRLRESAPALSWTSIAHTTGYFDQMHLIRDFKIFTGVLPTVVDKELAGTATRLQADLQL